jgi:hypothetical protein
MATFRFEIYARLRGALGIWQTYRGTVEAIDSAVALRQLYDQYEHIHRVKLTVELVPPPAVVVPDGMMYWAVEYDGKRWVMGESHGVASAVAEALNHPAHWEPTEAYEIAKGIREAVSRAHP